jgi:RimJ/RimL family protein N-acetyltransferase
LEIGPTLTTARLLLRPPQQQDFVPLMQMAQEEETMRFLGGVSAPNASWRALATLAGSWVLLGFGMFSVVRRDNGEWIGRIGPWCPGGVEADWPGNEVGWGLRRRALGQGFATEASIASIDWAFEHLGWDHVIHCIDKQNLPSIALAERLGSSLEREDVPLPAPFEGARVDVYGQSKQHWIAHRRSR